jgi:hypothetical protein
VPRSVIKFWERKGFSYYAYIYLYRDDGRSMGTITKKLDPFSYHLIKLIHGEKGLIDMVCNSEIWGYKNGDLDW